MSTYGYDIWMVRPGQSWQGGAAMTESREIAARDTTSNVETLRKAAQGVYIVLRLCVAWLRMGLIGRLAVMGMQILVRGPSI